MSFPGKFKFNDYIFINKEAFYKCKFIYILPRTFLWTVSLCVYYYAVGI